MKFEPMNPAPPVIRMLCNFLILLLYHIRRKFESIVLCTKFIKKIDVREQRHIRNALLKFLALSHKKNPRIFACENRRILTQKTESRAVSHMPPRKHIIFFIRYHLFQKEQEFQTFFLFPQEGLLNGPPQAAIF